jgi:transposase
MDAASQALPHTVDALRSALAMALGRAADAEAELAAERAERSADRALIAHLKLQILKLNRERFGPRSERTARLLDQLELQLEELEASASEDELAAEQAAAKTTRVASFERRKPSRQPLPVARRSG